MLSGLGRGRRWILVLPVVAAVGVYTFYRDQPRAGRGVGFADLDAVLAGEVKAGWSVAVPPKRPGPYRLVPDSPATAPGGGSTFRIRGPDGEVEEVRLDPGQKAVELDTPDGHRTLVVLQRAK